MADFYFFTEPDLLELQQQEEAYGPVSDSDSAYESGRDKFRTTDLHSASGTIKAFAICKGKVCLQEVYDENEILINDIVNLILKPEQQPGNDLPYICYYIYKGIMKDSLIIGNEIVTGGNDLVENIYQKTAIPNNITSVPKKSFGLHMNKTYSIGLVNFEDNDLIDNLFYKGDSDFPLHTVKGGWHIGDFDPNKFGLEIILEKINYRPTLLTTRTLENFVNVDSLPLGNYNYNDPAYFKHWHDKEKILNFLDPCHFWGSFSNQLKFRQSTYPKYQKLTYEEIFSTILKGTSGNYYNRKKVLLDIRNEHNFTFNYYKNYGNEIQLAFNDNHSSAIDFYQSGWGIYYIEIPSSILVSERAVNYSLKLPKGENTRPIVYLSQRAEVERIPDKELFLFPYQIANDDYLSPVKFYIPITEENGQACFRASIVRILYSKGFDKTEYVNPPQVSTTIHPFTHHLNNIFDPIQMKIPFDREEKLAIKMFNEEIIIDKSKIGEGVFVGFAGLCEDDDNYTYFVIPYRSSKTQQIDDDLFGKSTYVDSHSLNSSYLQFLQTQYNFIFCKRENIVSGNPISTYSHINSFGMGKKISALIVKKSVIDNVKDTLPPDLDFHYEVYVSLKANDSNSGTIPEILEVFDLLLIGFNTSTQIESAFFNLQKKEYSNDNH